MLKQEGEGVVLRNDGPPEPSIEPGDFLRTRTGRVYLVEAVCGRQLHCVVMANDVEIRGRVFRWSWTPRRRRSA